MNLDFGILWIEDSYSAEEADSLRRRVQEAGFVARIEVLPNGADLERHARDHQLFHEFDLILLDYKLQDEHGDELAPRVRELFPSTTVLFYSGSVTSEQELRAKIAAKPVEGVYCCARGRFIQRAGELIDQTAGSLDRLPGMRGLAMKVVAECDQLMKDTVLSMSARDATCAATVTKLDEDVIGFLDKQKAKYEASMSSDLAERIATRAVDSAKLFTHFRRLTKAAAAQPATFGLDGKEVERLRELRSNSSDYVASILDKRNVLGHVVEVRTDSGWMLQGSSDIAVSDFPALRSTFASYFEAFREIGALVTRLDREEAEQGLA